MEFRELLHYILYVLLTVIVPVAAKYAVEVMKAKIKESNMIASAVRNEDLSGIIEGALSDVMDAVLYVNQVYVDSLKSSGRFDQAAQEEAFNKAYAKAMGMISSEAKKAIGQLYGSFDKWLKLKIESSVNAAKKQ